MSDKGNKITKKRALNVLDIYEKDPSIEKIKRQYRILALKYHPDKNNAPDACSKFQELNDAYKFFESNTNMYAGIDTSDEEESMKKGSNYQCILYFFLKTIFQQEPNTRVLFEIIQKLVTICEDKSLALLDNIDKNIVIKIYETMKAYGEIFHFTEAYIEKVEELIKKKLDNDERIILHPFLDDLFENNIYKICVNSENYFVPLWHHELIYDCSGGELFIECVPILPENIGIDDKNNIIVVLNYTIMELCRLEDINFCIGNNKFSFPRKSLYIEKEQTHILANQGISMINTRDIYDVSKKSDIYVFIEIEF